jgi:hypothetical protein
MSAPVMRCEIVPSMTITGCGDPETTHARVQNDTGVWVSALAVPDALWGQLTFIESVRTRFGLQYGWPNLNQCAALIAAIHAELRARAGGG